MVQTITLTPDGQALSIADLFYSDVDILAYINARIAYAGINEEQQKRAFTGYTALPAAFLLTEGRIDLKIDANDPFFAVSDIYISLSPQVSPYGKDYVDVSWQDTGIPFSFDKSNIHNTNDPRTTLLVPVVRFDNGETPQIDAAVNTAIQAMIPALKKAGTSAFPLVYVYDGCLSVVYQERETAMGDGGAAYAAAVPGGALLWDIHTGKPADIATVVAANQWLYAPLTGDPSDYFPGENVGEYTRWNYYFPAISGYTPPAGSVYSDLYWDGYYFLTVTQPDGQRVLMAQAGIYIGQQ